MVLNPASVCRALNLPLEWQEDCVNKALACAACKGFRNRYKPSDPIVLPGNLDEFCVLRDRIFVERKELIAKSHERNKRFLRLVRGKNTCSALHTNAGVNISACHETVTLLSVTPVPAQTKKPRAILPGLFRVDSCRFVDHVTIICVAFTSFTSPCTKSS